MKVVITDYQYDDINQERKIISDAGFELFDYQEKDPKKLIPLVKDADAIITQYSDIDAEVISALEHCKIIIKYGIGTNNIDSDAATKKGIFVCNVPDYGVDEVSNHAVTMILMLSKKIMIETKYFREGEWGYSHIAPVFRFCESTVGLVGFGRIPQLVAKKLSGFGCKIIAYDPYVSDDVFAKLQVERVSFEDLCRRSDFISIHSPLTKETTHIFNCETFDKMKRTAFLINTARGPIINQDDLIDALEKGKIAGAGLDVYETEPLEKDNRLFDFDNVILTPHCAWYSQEAITTLQKKVAIEVVNVLQGNKPFNCVNKDVLKK